MDGFITDQPGPHQVTLTTTADYVVNAVNFHVGKAIVVVVDDQNRRQELTEVSTGIYRTPATFKGQAGRSYTLNISLPDGRRFVSQPETIRPAPPILAIYDEYTEVPSGGGLAPGKGFNVYLDTKDPAPPGDYYRWVWTHFNPINFCATETVAGVVYGFTCCQACWDIVWCSGPNCTNATSDEAINGNAISRQFIMRAPYTSKSRFYLEIEQLSLSRSAYLYYQTIANLTQSNGGIFDAAPASLRGNISSTTNPNELVFGYFSASGVQKVPHVIERSRGNGQPTTRPTPLTRPGPPPPCAPCAEGDSRTRVAPRWWTF